MYKKQQGITLIALVITIIVMLILAGVTLSVVVGDNGVLNQAKKAVDKNKQATALEQVTMAWAGLKADYYSGWVGDTSVAFSSFATKENLQRYVESTGTVNSIVDNGNTTYVIEYTMDNEEKTTYMFLAEENGKVTLMDGLNVVPSTLSMQRVVNGSEVTETPATVKAILTNATGTINWTTSGDTSAVALSATTGETITVTPKGAGTVTLTASAESGTYTDTCTITVTQVTAITTVGALSPASGTVNKGATTTITASNIAPSTATEVLSWTSSNTAVAAITPAANGRSVTVAGNSNGTATITATAANGNSSTATITVVEPATINYIVDGSTTSTNTNAVVGGTVGTMPSNPSKTGCTFKGWYTSATGGTQVTTSTEVTSSEMNVYAQFTVTLTFAPNSGTFSDSSTTNKTVTGDYGATVTLPTITRNGYAFNGWYTAASGGTEVYSKTTTSTTLTADATVYAQWGEEGYFGTPLNADKYGYKVTGYTGGITGTVWRLFFQDSDYTYIIADPTTTVYKPSDYYSSTATGAGVSTEGQNLNSKLKNAGTFFVEGNTNNNIKATAWLTDTSSTSLWTTSYKDTGANAIAQYAIGSPTIEMYLASFKATHTSSTASVGVGTYGYTCSGLTSNNSLGTAGDYHGIYRYNSSDNKRYWWLASPYGGYDSGEWNVNSSSGCLDGSSVAVNSYGVRPVVCILTSTFNAKVTAGTITLTDAD